MKTSYEYGNLTIVRDVNVPRGGACSFIATYPDGTKKKIVLRPYYGGTPDMEDWDKADPI